MHLLLLFLFDIDNNVVYFTLCIPPPPSSSDWNVNRYSSGAMTIDGERFSLWLSLLLLLLYVISIASCLIVVAYGLVIHTTELFLHQSSSTPHHVHSSTLLLPSLICNQFNRLPVEGRVGVAAPPFAITTVCWFFDQHFSIILWTKANLKKFIFFIF
jgi:hypothetical protein